MEEVLNLIRKLRRADDTERAAIKAELIELSKGPPRPRPAPTRCART